MAPPGAVDNGVKSVVPVSVMKLSDSAADVPEKFIKAIGERPTVAYNDYCKEIPVISLKGINSSEAERARIVGEVGLACAEWGIFQVVDHGVPDDLMKRMMENALAFFKLPLEEKLKYATKPGGFPVGYASGSHRSDDDILDWRELMVHRCLPSSIREQDINNMWPESPETYRKTLADYSDSVDTLVTAVLGLISESLGLPTDYIKNAVGGDRAEQKILCNYYPQCPQPDLTLGLRSHTDYGTITVLQQEIGGLQAYKEDREHWVTVEPIPGALVINLGDQIQILSNAKYCSVEHQAVVNSNETRLTLVVFANPNSLSQMGPAPELLNAENSAKYRSYTFKDYLPICYAKQTKKHYDALAI